LKRLLSAFIVGLLFALGLGISGMTDPRKVVAFLDITGRWDPSLAFVMLGAVCVHALFVRVASHRARPLLASAFVLPTETRIDARLLAGAALFGLGWGAAGYCPGPALVALAGLSAPTAVFAATMVLGIFGFRWWRAPSGSLLRFVTRRSERDLSA